MEPLPIAAAQGDLLVALAGCLGVLCLAVLGVSICFWRLGAAVVARGRFPLAGASGMHDGRGVRGAAAHRYGRGLQFFGLALPVAFLCAAILAWRAYQALAASLP